jgi:hypothetical protein
MYIHGRSYENVLNLCFIVDLCADDLLLLSIYEKKEYTDRSH